MKLNKIVIAPDSFKESMTSEQVGHTIKDAFKQILPQHISYDVIPVADGGEGTTAALTTALDATSYSVTVNDPLMRPIDAKYSRSDKQQVAVIEMAAASGLDLLIEEEKNPLKTTSYGTGELILDALNHGATTIILGIGGSATNDGGSGMLSALGVKFYDQHEQLLTMNGENLAQVHHIDRSQLDSRLQNVSFKVACDVTNPLLGDQGATVVYGPQKGATSKMIPKLDSAMAHYHDKIQASTGKHVKDIAGAGAAGGMGAALLAFFNAELSKGIDVVFEITQFHQRVKDADLVITGEGKIDHQTIYGKTPIGVAQVAKQYHIPVIAISGSLGDDYQAIYDHGIDSAFAIVPSPTSLSDALANGEQYLFDTALSIARLLQLQC